MSTPRERAEWAAHNGFAPCFANWGGHRCMSCRCGKPEGHTGFCKCEFCGSEHVFPKSAPVEPGKEPTP